MEHRLPAAPVDYLGKQGQHPESTGLAHLSPLGWEHVNLTGDYVWAAQQGKSENTDGLRPLRVVPGLALKAA